MRAAMILLLWLWPAGLPAWAESDRLTTGDVTEVAGLIDTVLTGSGDFALAEAKAGEFYSLILRDFGAESREALQIEWLIVLAVTAQGRSDEGVGLGAQMMAKAERLLTASDPLGYKCAAAYAVALRTTGKAAEALALLSDALSEAERRLPPDALEVDELRLLQVQSAVTEGDLELAQAGYALLDARLSARRDPAALALRSMAMIGWSQLVADHGNPAAAVPLYAATLAAIDVQFGTLKFPRMQPIRLTTVVLMAEAMETAGQRDKVPALLRPLLAEVAAHYGTDSPFWADLAFMLAVALAGDAPGGVGQPEAIQLLQRVVAIRAAVGGDTVDLLRARQNYAVLLAANGRAAEAVAQLRAMHGAALPGTRGQIVYVLRSAQESGALTREQAVEAALVWLQDSQSTGAAAAQRLLTARLEAGSDEGAALLRARSDLRTRLQTAHAALSAQTTVPLAARDAAEVAALRVRIGRIGDDLLSVSQDLAAKTPKLAGVTGQGTLSLAQIRDRLKPDEALVVIDPPQDAGDVGLIVAVNADAVDWHTFQVPAPDVEAAVGQLRAGIDLRLGVRSAAALTVVDRVEDFDLATAYRLYAQTAGQVVGVTAGKAHLYFDLRGAVAALPPQLLVMSPPLSDDPAKADWLIRHHAVTVLPAIASLPPATPRTAPATGFLAFADARHAGLAPLPETAGEVRAVAAALRQDEDTLRLGADATEAAVKAAALDSIGTLYFATHGLVGGDRVGGDALPQAALALTPGGGEDGLLTASEIIDLRLNARIVVLSACNTASGGVPGAEALSGLAQAFLYAGARGLLVSHWPVESRSAARLMSDTFSALASTPGIGLARAQQQAILTMIDHPPDPRWSHPAYWAPFVLVGSPD